MGRCGNTMYVELRVEETREEYKPEAEKNRLEVYESLLLDTSSALWRELVHRKEGRNAVSAVSTTSTTNTSSTENTTNTTNTENTTNTSNTEKSEVFDIDSEEEEKKLPVKDPSRDVGHVGRCER